MAVRVSVNVNGKALVQELKPRLLLRFCLRNRPQLTGTHTECETFPNNKMKQQAANGG